LRVVALHRERHAHPAVRDRDRRVLQRRAEALQRFVGAAFLQRRLPAAHLRERDRVEHGRL